jgi:hypothetical protein
MTTAQVERQEEVCREMEQARPVAISTNDPPAMEEEPVNVGKQRALAGPTQTSSEAERPDNTPGKTFETQLSIEHSGRSEGVAAGNTTAPSMPRFGDSLPRGPKSRELGTARRKGEMGPVGVEEEEGGTCNEQNPENEQEPVPDETGSKEAKRK